MLKSHSECFGQPASLPPGVLLSPRDGVVVPSTNRGEGGLGVRWL